MISLRIDPEKSEEKALSTYAGNFAGKRVLEVGCGNGRVTALYALQAASVHAIDPDQGDIAAALDNLAPGLHDRVHFEAISIEAYWSETRFDAVLMSWSL